MLLQCLCFLAGKPRPYDYNGNINDNGNKKECFCIFTNPTVGTRRALSEEFKARMSLKTQVPRLSVLINNNRGISDVREFRAKKNSNPWYA